MKGSKALQIQDKELDRMYIVQVLPNGKWVIHLQLSDKRIEYNVITTETAIPKKIKQEVLLYINKCRQNFMANNQ